MHCMCGHSVLHVTENSKACLKGVPAALVHVHIVIVLPSYAALCKIHQASRMTASQKCFAGCAVENHHAKEADNLCGGGCVCVRALQ